MRFLQHTSIIVVLLVLGACGSSPIKQEINWFHPERSKVAFYLDDEACLKQVNNILFNQLLITESLNHLDNKIDTISDQNTSNKVCKSNEDRNLLHYNCMIKRGWSEQ